MRASEDLSNTFGRSWELLTGNWILLIPGIVIGIVAAVIIFLVVGAMFATGGGLVAVGAGGAGLGALAMGGMLTLLIMLLAVLLTIAYTTGMAGAAWETGSASLADGSAAFRKHGGSILVAFILLALLGLVASVLSFVTLFLSLFAFGVFFLYTFASVIVGGRSGVEGIGESARLALRNFWMTLAILILLCVVSWLGTWAGNLFAHIPLLGKIVQLVIQEIVIVYSTLVIVGEYLKLRTVGAVPVATTAPPTP